MNAIPQFNIYLPEEIYFRYVKAAERAKIPLTELARRVLSGPIESELHTIARGANK